MLKLGCTVRDKITGFTGVVTGFVTYISGCNQALVIPKVGADNKPVEACWFDEQRLVVDNTTEVLELDNGDTPGFDAPAPIR